MDETMLTVRDHSRPCEHGSRYPHWINVREGRWWREPECLGGREIVLRRVPRTPGTADDWCWIEAEAEQPGTG